MYHGVRFMLRVGFKYGCFTRCCMKVPMFKLPVQRNVYGTSNTLWLRWRQKGLEHCGGGVRHAWVSIIWLQIMTWAPPLHFPPQWPPTNYYIITYLHPSMHVGLSFHASISNGFCVASPHELIHWCGLTYLKFTFVLSSLHMKVQYSTNYTCWTLLQGL
jgi:hypothetical protein